MPDMVKGQSGAIPFDHEDFLVIVYEQLSTIFQLSLIPEGQHNSTFA